MKRTIRIPRGPLVILPALLAALLIAACGGSGGAGASSKKPSKNASATTTTKGATATRTALATCLKQHGVTLGARGTGRFGFRGGTTTNGTPPSGGAAPPSGAGSGTPPAGGSGGFPGGGGGFAGGNSKFAKAFTACRKKLGLKSFGSFGPGGRRFGNGAGGFTRPRITTATLKSYVACIRKNGYAAMPEPKASSNGSFFPKSVESNTKFQAANRKCQSILVRGFRSSRPPTGTGTISLGTSTVSNA